MPRCARLKSYEAIYHIMSKSISEVTLFRSDEDKAEYLSITKHYQDLFNFKVYGYCLMDNHVHYMIDANGADISKIMHCINFKYAQYFNHTHDRNGHLFQDRFKSKIVKDERYLYALSAYIHNNATDIPEFNNRPQDYKFSSLGIYLGLSKDSFKLIDDSFVLSFFGSDLKTSRENYLKLVMKCKVWINKNEFEFENDKTEYRSCRKILVRDFKVENVIEFIAEKMDISKIKLYAKNSKGARTAKAILVFLLRSLCDMKCKDICSVLGNTTQSTVSKLCSMGIELLYKDERYEKYIEQFMEQYA
jgi:putative transposase